MEEPSADNRITALVLRGQHTKPHERRRVIEAWDASGLSAYRFAAQSGISVSNLRRWRRQTYEAPRQVSLVEVPHAAPSQASSDWAAEVSSKVGPIRFAAGASPVWAASLLREVNRC